MKYPELGDLTTLSEAYKLLLLENKQLQEKVRVLEVKLLNVSLNANAIAGHIEWIERINRSCTSEKLPKV